MTWHKDKIEKYIKENYSSVMTFFIFMFVCTLWHYFSGQKFVWRDVNLIDTPSIWYRALYSALAFLTLGRWLYKIKFYQFLYFLDVVLLHDKRGYRKDKKSIWAIMTIAMYLYIVPKIVDILNFAISLVINTIALILYLSPVIGICLISYLIYVSIKTKPVGTIYQILNLKYLRRKK